MYESIMMVIIYGIMFILNLVHAVFCTNGISLSLCKEIGITTIIIPHPTEKNLQKIIDTTACSRVENVLHGARLLCL